MEYKTYDHCRISDSKELLNFLHFKSALAGGFHKIESNCSTESKFPLTLSYCPVSNLVQVNEVINQNLLFDQYFYKTGTISTLVNHFNKLSVEIKKKFPHSKILEIGCNDFTFLSNFIEVSSKVVGVDPSDVSRNYQPKGAELYNNFFSFKESNKISTENGKFDVIFSSNSFAHIEDIRDVTRGIKNLLSEEGVLIIEVHWLGSLIENLQFPFIYHEHMYYYSLKSLRYLLNLYDITIFDIEKIETHGGSIRVFCGHAASKHKITSNVENFIKIEKKLGLYESKTFIDFGSKIETAKNKTLELLEKIKLDNKSIVGYGASGQANTLMAVFEITKKHLDYIVDDSPLKIGCYTPNNCLPIVSRDIMIKNTPDYIFCLAYTFIDEIIEKNKDIHTKWIKPLPTLEVIS